MPDSTRVASAVVRETIEQDGVVRYAFARGLLNLHALARSIQKSSQANVSVDAILSAIRRYPIDDIAEERATIGEKIRKISLKNNITVFSMRNHPAVHRGVAELAADIHYGRGETFRVVSSSETVSVTIDVDNSNKLTSRIPKARILKKYENLAEIVMATDTEGTIGVLSVITTELATNGVNIVQLSTIAPGRIILLVNERDATMTYQTLQALSKTKRPST